MCSAPSFFHQVVEFAQHPGLSVWPQEFDFIPHSISEAFPPIFSSIQYPGLSALPREFDFAPHSVSEVFPLHVVSSPAPHSVVRDVCSGPHSASLISFPVSVPAPCFAASVGLLAAAEYDNKSISQIEFCASSHLVTILGPFSYERESSSTKISLQHEALMFTCSNLHLS